MRAVILSEVCCFWAERNPPRTEVGRYTIRMRRLGSRGVVMCITQHNAASEITSKNLFRSPRMFSRTQNENGTYNTRCLYCFMTVASAVESAKELDDVEMHHVCPEKALADLVARSTGAPSLVHPH